MPSLHLTDPLRAELFVYAREADPEEACGFLIGTLDGAAEYRVTHVRPARNLHPSREDRFAVDPLEYRKAEKFCAKHAAEGLRVLGFWHSHPQSPPRPSSVDLEQAQGLYASFYERYLYVIVSPNEGAGELACWQLNEQGKAFEPLPFEAKR